MASVLIQKKKQGQDLALPRTTEIGRASCRERV